MKYNVKIILENQEVVLEDTDFYADTDHEAVEYALLHAQFKGYEKYAIFLTSEDSDFKMMCYGTRGTHIKV